MGNPQSDELGKSGARLFLNCACVWSKILSFFTSLFFINSVIAQMKRLNFFLLCNHLLSMKMF